MGTLHSDCGVTQDVPTLRTKPAMDYNSRRQKNKTRERAPMKWLSDGQIQKKAHVLVTTVIWARCVCVWASGDVDSN